MCDINTCYKCKDFRLKEASEGEYIGWCSLNDMCIDDVCCSKANEIGMSVALSFVVLCNDCICNTLTAFRVGANNANNAERIFTESLSSFDKHRYSVVAVVKDERFDARG